MAEENTAGGSDEITANSAEAGTGTTQGTDAEGKTLATGGEGTPEADGKKADDAGAEGTQEAEAGKKADTDASDGAPEKYEEFAFGEDFVPNAEQVEVFTGLAKELELTQVQAQKLVDFRIAEEKAQAEAKWDEWTKGQDELVAATKTDKEIGGENLEKNLAHVGAFIKKFGTSEFVDLLDTTGAGNHVEIIRVLARAGALLAEDGITSGAAAHPPASQADILYGSPPTTK